MPLAQARTLNELRYASVAVQESRAIILSCLAALALGLVGVGLYGNSSDMTSQRTFEIGVRPTDLLTYAAATAVLLLVAAWAVVVPALRAVRVDPALTLKSGVRC